MRWLLKSRKSHPWAGLGLFLQQGMKRQTLARAFQTGCAGYLASPCWSNFVGHGLSDLQAPSDLLQGVKGVLHMQGGGVRVNNEKVAEETQAVAEEDLIEGRLLLLATGKKNKLVLRIE